MPVPLAVAKHGGRPPRCGWGIGSGALGSITDAGQTGCHSAPETGSKETKQPCPESFIDPHRASTTHRPSLRGSAAPTEARDIQQSRVQEHSLKNSNPKARPRCKEGGLLVHSHSLRSQALMGSGSAASLQPCSPALVPQLPGHRGSAAPRGRVGSAYQGLSKARAAIPRPPALSTCHCYWPKLPPGCTELAGGKLWGVIPPFT